MVKAKSELKLQRMKAGLTATESAKLLGISKQRLSNYETGWSVTPQDVLDAMKVLYKLD